MNNNIPRLELLYNDITDSGIAHIFNSLAKNTTLKHINLAHNKITCNGATFISRVLRKNKTLTYVRLGDNRILDEGKLAFLSAIKKKFYIKGVFCRDADDAISNPIQDAIKYHTDLNNFCHGEILKHDNLPISFWPYISAHFSRCRTGVLYYYVKSKPGLFKPNVGYEPVSILGKQRREQ